MNKPLLSIITINYNNAEGLKKTMQSVLDLEFKDYEYIIIDGGSSDNSVDVIKDFLENTELKDKITFWCSEKDKGIYNAMNKGLTHVNGTLVNMMNSGDCFISDSLNKLPIWEKENKDAVLYGAISKWDNEGFICCTSSSPKDLGHTSLNHQASFIPMSIHKKYGYYSEKFRIVSDYEMWLRLYTNNVKFYWINTIICNFDNTGISSVPNYERWKEKEIVQKQYGTYVAPSFLSKCKKFVKKIFRLSHK